MINYKARNVVGKAETEGLSHKEIAKICDVSLVTVSRWKTKGRAKANVISRLEEHLDSISNKHKGQEKRLNEASLEDLADRALQLGFRLSFTDIREK